MFNIAAAPTFEADITLIGQGREQKLHVTFQHMPKDDYSQMLQDIADGKIETAEAVSKVINAWDADMDLGLDALNKLEQNQPGACWAIFESYGASLSVARKGN